MNQCRIRQQIRATMHEMSDHTYAPSELVQVCMDSLTFAFNACFDLAVALCYCAAPNVGLSGCDSHHAAPRLGHASAAPSKRHVAHSSIPAFTASLMWIFNGASRYLQNESVYA
jgi:hypothetical protein